MIASDGGTWPCAVGSRACPSRRCFTCTIVVGELARGIAALSDNAKRRQQEHHLHQVVIPSFPILPFDLDASLRWGTLMGEGQRNGAIPSNDDTKIAAIAASHGLTVATSNIKDFERLGVACIDPGAG